jgi:hypothetical protein
LAATLSIATTDSSVTWYPGAAASSGVYIYVILIEDTAFSGTLEVIR